MDLRPRMILARFRGKALRYMTVSLIGTVLTQILLFGMVDGLDWNGALANVIAVTLTSIPSFILNKRWVWSHGDPASVKRQVLPFWGLSIAGLILSTIFAAIAYAVYDAGWAVSLANLAGFGVLWVAKFLILDEYLFNKPVEAT